MKEQSVEIVNRLGLHARAAAKLVNLAGSFRCDIALVFEGEEVEGKSILGILMLGAAQGSDVIIRCDGEDEEEALAALVALFQDRFGEGS